MFTLHASPPSTSMQCWVSAHGSPARQPSRTSQISPGAQPDPGACLHEPVSQVSTVHSMASTHSASVVQPPEVDVVEEVDVDVDVAPCVAVGPGPELGSPPAPAPAACPKRSSPEPPHAAAATSANT